MSDDTDGLIFAPLGWIYHDSWRWRESKTIVESGSNGQPSYTDAGKTCYNRGHCHMFFPGIDMSKNGSGQMYWGEQKYEFNVVDEWGPNSTDPLTNKSIRLVGKPVWYFHIEEYWRRIYVQPWDAVDMTCELPLNQDVSYEKKTWTAHLQNLIETAGLLNSTGAIDADWTTLEDIDLSGSGIGYMDYLQILRRTKARALYAQSTKDEYLDWYKENVDDKATEPPMDNDRQILSYIVSPRTSTEEGESETYDLKNLFNEFFLSGLAEYDGYVDPVATMESFLDRHGIRTMPAGAKMGEDGSIYIPTGQTVGHVGIKWDASKPCHSLGPFREGGDFYFFNTVVNRTMPCEYWLDEAKRSRQYYLKQSAEGIETSGGQTWTFGGDDSKFYWVMDTFADAAEALGKSYEEDGWFYKSGNKIYSYMPHRMRKLVQSTDTSYEEAGFNAKRLRTDRHLDISSGNAHTLLYQYVDSMPSAQLVWVGSNSEVVKDQYDEEAWAEDMAERDQPDPTRPSGHFDENEGWVEDTSSSSSSSSSGSSFVKSENSISWEKRSWKGFYEKGELVKCAMDEKWYRRDWGPFMYSPGGTMGEDDEEHAQPYWTRRKRQWFPNPPPWLCDDDSEEGSDPAEILSRFPYPVPREHFATQCKENWSPADNRLHLLHWEYAHYYGIVRTYPETGEPSESHYNVFNMPNESGVVETVLGGAVTDENRLYYIRTIAGDWETRLDDYKKDNGTYPESIEEEDAIFNEWIGEVEEFFITQYRDRYMYYEVRRDSEGRVIESTLIPDSMINYSNGTYRVEKGYDYEKDEYIYEEKPLPDPVYTVNYGGEQPLTFITFNEFRRIWHHLDEHETRGLALEGDMPRRNETPYPTILDSKDTLNPSSHSTEEYLGAPRNEYQFMEDEEEFRFGAKGSVTKMNASALNDKPASPMQTAFFPVVDVDTRTENEKRSKQKPPLPQYPLTPLDEVGDNIAQSAWDSMTAANKKKYMRYYVETGAPIDPYKNHGVDPIENWKLYFTHREEFTIPSSTVVGGDCSVTSDKSTPNSPLPHPREASYSCEDGARRMYPDDMFITPIIEYQRVVRTNSSVNPDGYIRLAGKEQEAAFMDMFKEVPDATGKYNSAGAWRTDKAGNWGDGFTVSVSIPYKINGEIQSPFSDASKVVSPPGEYHHSCVKPEDMLRYHIEFYDSLEQIWRYDFPNYVNLMRAFQRRYIPEGASNPNDLSLSLYREDFNDHAATLKYRKDPKAENIPEGLECWQDAVDQYWLEIDAANHFSDHPVVRCHDCYGNETVENSFVTLDDGTEMWRERTTYMMPTEDKMAKIETGDNEYEIGYRDSNGNLVRGGDVVKWNNPFGDKADGKWVEQCLGAVVKAKCYLVLEDALGYRWIQEVSDTAMQSSDPIRGSDYDL